MIIYRGEETIHKMNETPSDVECNGYRKKNDAANNIRFSWNISKRFSTNWYILHCLFMFKLNLDNIIAIKQ